MKTLKLIKRLSDLHVRVWAEGEKLKWKAPEGIVRDELLAEIRERKSEILDLLKAIEIGNGGVGENPIPAPKAVKRGTGDFTLQYRPRRISEVYGQSEIKKYVAHGLDTGTLAHALLFQGVSGTGKTTMGRIVAMGLNCEKGPTSEPCCECYSCKATMNGNSFAFQEFDAAHLSGVETVREKVGDFYAAPMGGERCRVVLFDECHRLSTAAQAALLKHAEDVPWFLYYIFCTTKEIIEPLRNRCMQFRFDVLPHDDIRALLLDVSASENLIVEPAQIESIIAEAKGMPRNALLLLQEESCNAKRPKGNLVEIPLLDKVALGD